MMRAMYQAAVVLFLLWLPAPSLLFAAAPEVPESKSEIENLKRRIEILEAEKGVEEQPFGLSALGKMITFGGLLELEASYEKTEGDEEGSDIALATAELATAVRVNENIGGHVLFLWEEDGTDSVEVDEAVVELSCPLSVAGQSLTFAGGKMYLPFGMFNSFFISDPLTLELGETNASAAALGLAGPLWTVNLGVFNGETDTAADDDHIDSWVASLTLTPVEGVALGGSLLSDLAESGNGLVMGESGYSSSVAGGTVFASFVLGRFGLELEYLTALDEFDESVVSAALDEEGDLTGRRPSAWNAELAWQPTERWQLGAKIEGADDFRDDVMRYGAVVSHGLFENTVIGLEYLFADSDADEQDKSHLVTAQLAFEF